MQSFGPTISLVFVGDCLCFDVKLEETQCTYTVGYVSSAHCRASTPSPLLLNFLHGVEEMQSGLQWMSIWLNCCTRIQVKTLWINISQYCILHLKVSLVRIQAHSQAFPSFSLLTVWHLSFDHVSMPNMHSQCATGVYPGQDWEMIQISVHITIEWEAKSVANCCLVTR